MLEIIVSKIKEFLQILYNVHNSNLNSYQIKPNKKLINVQIWNKMST